MAKRRGPTPNQRSRRVPSAEKANYHQNLGAGKSGTLRPFVGATERELDTVSALLQKRYDARLRAGARTTPSLSPRSR